jgi:hypothetical protein
MSLDYEASTDPRHLLPRRFILRPGVVSPLTCRHPKQVRCSCHGSEAAKAQQQPGSTPAKQTKAQAQAIRDLELAYQRHLSSVLFALRSFPEACAAVNELLFSSLPPNNGAQSEDDDDNDNNNAPFPC